MDTPELYESYHSNRKSQKRIISRKDFTYRNLLFFLNKYLKSEKRILDIGCGVGGVDVYLGSLGHRVLGIDLSKNAILKARQNAKSFKIKGGIEFSVIDFPKVTPAGEYDIIICSEVLEHLKDDKAAVQQIKKLLRKGGIVIASAPSLNAPLYKIGWLRDFDKKVGHLRRYTLTRFKMFFLNSGLEVIETKNTEGVLRNFLFTNQIGGFLLKFLNKWPLSVFVSFVDDLMIPIFGESNFYIVAKNV